MRGVFQTNRLPFAALTRRVSRLRLLDSAPISKLEAAVSAAFLLVLGAVAYGSHVIHGGFVHDDWAYLADAKFHSFTDAVALNRVSTGNRILHAYYIALVHRVFGTHAHAHLAWITFLAVLMSFSLYLLLRNLEVARLHSLAIAGLTLLFPATSASRLWITGATPQLAISLYLLGVVVALRGLRARSYRAVALHALAVAMFVASLLLYEICAVAVLATVALYALRAPWRAARLRWPIDVAAVVVTLAYMNTGRVQRVNPLQDQVAHAAWIGGQAGYTLLSIGIPNGHPRLTSPLVLASIAFGLVMLAIVARAIAVWRALDRDSATSSEIRYWLAFMAAGMAAIAVGYAMFVPADRYYSPLGQGIVSRVNILAAAGYVIVLYGLLVLTATLVFRGRRRGSQLRVAVTVVGTLALAAVYLHQLGIEKSYYDRSWALQDRILHVLRSDVRPPPEGTTLYAFKSPADTAPSVPVFGASWDLTGAIRVLWNDYSLFAVPDTTLTGISCQASGVKPRGVLYATYSSRYGRSLFVDTTTGRAVMITSRSACRKLLPTFTSLR